MPGVDKSQDFRLLSSTAQAGVSAVTVATIAHDVVGVGADHDQVIEAPANFDGVAFIIVHELNIAVVAVDEPLPETDNDVEDDDDVDYESGRHQNIWQRNERHTD